MRTDTFDIVSQRIFNVHNALVRDGHNSSDVADAMFFNILRAYVAGGTGRGELHTMLDKVYDATAHLKPEETTLDEVSREASNDGAQQETA